MATTQTAMERRLEGRLLFETSGELEDPAHLKPSAIDLFAGCGGMSLGLKKAGFQVVYAVEINEDAAATYKHNFPDNKLVVQDVRKVDPRKVKKELKISKVDIIVAGPPCQGFSIAGRRQARDRRNRLFEEVLEFVEVFNPKIVVIENVVGMLSMSGGRVVEEIKNELRKLGYFPHVKTLKASDFGVPQNRERVFIIACTKDMPEEELFPIPFGNKVSVLDAISDLDFLGVKQKATEYVRPPSSEYQMLMRGNAHVLNNHESPNHSKKIQKRFSVIPLGKNGRDILKKETGKHTYFKLDPMKPSRTLTTLPEDFVHYLQNRIPTVREMARLQSFPDNFVFCGPRTTGGPRRRKECPQYTQVGNAVPPLLAAAVFINLAEVVRCYY